MGTQDEQAKGTQEMELLKAEQLATVSQEVPLTPIEFRILAYLAQNAGRVVTQDLLLEHVWGNACRATLSSGRGDRGPSLRGADQVREQCFTGPSQ